MSSHAAASALASSSHAAVAPQPLPPPAPAIVSRRCALLGAVSSAALAVSAPPLPLAAAAVRGDLTKGLFFRGASSLPLGSAIRPVRELIAYLTSGELAADLVASAFGRRIL